MVIMDTYEAGNNLKIDLELLLKKRWSGPNRKNVYLGSLLPGSVTDFV